MPIAGYYTTTEAAKKLGLTRFAIQNAVRRGALRAETSIKRRILIPAEEVERYAREVQGTQGWDKRKQPDYTPNTRHQEYQRPYHQRRKAARQQLPAKPAEE